MLEAGNPLSFEDQLQVEEQKDEKLFEAVVSDLQLRQRHPLLLLPPPSKFVPFSSLIRAGAPPIEATSAPPPRTEDTGPSEERPLPPSPASEAPPAVEVPASVSSSSGQAEDLMERVQHLMVSIKELIDQPTPLSQQTSTAEPDSLATLIEAVRQLRIFL